MVKKPLVFEPLKFNYCIFILNILTSSQFMFPLQNLTCFVVSQKKCFLKTVCKLSRHRSDCLICFGIFVEYLGLITVKILKIGIPEIITIIVLQLEQLDFTVQYCVQKMQT